LTEHIHSDFMMQCLVLAANGMGYVSPNPLVGAVLVHEGKVIGAGYHMAYGEAHAEVNCIASVQPEYHQLIAESTMYVSLEPCAHYGKTPPCVDAIVASGIKKVVVGAQDIFAKVNGLGISKLKDSGVDVIENVLQSECARINRRFFTFHSKERPYIILKWAESADGFIAADKNVSTQISSEQSMIASHQWRTQEDAILVGYNTAVIDNPRLTARYYEGRNPIRIVIDKQVTLYNTLNIFDDEAETIVISETPYSNNAVKNIIASDVDAMLHGLYEKNIQSLIIEGGAKTLQSFIDANVWDECRQIVSPNNLVTGVAACKLNNAQFLYAVNSGIDKINYYKNPQNIYL
jgi:diaminohydroxyphosphoribosylaminopyrimidine deaminase / 5-amino-6-(5-phosphoribosylamino)uracil reductase